jgi:hypothetical protein
MFSAFYERGISGMAARILKVQELDTEGGKPARNVTLKDLAFEPLGFTDLRGAILHRPTRFPFAGTGTIIDEPNGGQRGRFRMMLKSRFTSKAIGLVKGGWLPSGMALEDDSIMMPDRCVVAQLNARLRGGTTRLAQNPTSLIYLLTAPSASIQSYLFLRETAVEIRVWRPPSAI